MLLLLLLGPLLPVKPPAMLLSPAVTIPLAAELPINPWFSATRPPTSRYATFTAPTAPDANPNEMVPVASRQIALLIPSQFHHVKPRLNDNTSTFAARFDNRDV